MCGCMFQPALCGCIIIVGDFDNVLCHLMLWAIFRLHPYLISHPRMHAHTHSRDLHSETWKEVVVEETIRATVIKPNQAIKLRARKETLVCVHMTTFSFSYSLCPFQFHIQALSICPYFPFFPILQFLTHSSYTQL